MSCIVVTKLPTFSVSLLATNIMSQCHNPQHRNLHMQRIQALRKEHNISFVNSFWSYISEYLLRYKGPRLSKLTDLVLTNQDALFHLYVTRLRSSIIVRLSNYENPPENQKLFITLDLTSHDQEVNKNLRAELKELDKEESL